MLAEYIFLGILFYTIKLNFYARAPHFFVRLSYNNAQ